MLQNGFRNLLPQTKSADPELEQYRIKFCNPRISDRCAGGYFTVCSIVGFHFDHERFDSLTHGDMFLAFHMADLSDAIEFHSNRIFTVKRIAAGVTAVHKHIIYP